MISRYLQEKKEREPVLLVFSYKHGLFVTDGTTTDDTQLSLYPQRKTCRRLVIGLAGMEPPAIRGRLHSVEGKVFVVS